MDDYQVWHKDGKTYKHVADVAAGDPQTAALRTMHGLLAPRWQDAEGVAALPGEHRSTEFGDIILAPDGEEYKFAAITLDGHNVTVAGFEPTHELRQQLYAEWRDDQSQRDLHDRSVDFADQDNPALLGEFLTAARESTSVQRVERQIDELKSRPEFVEPVYREIFDADGVGEYVDDEVNLGSWDQLPDHVRLRELVYLDWSDVSAAERSALLEREVDFSKVSERKQREIMGEVRQDAPKPEPSDYQRALQAAIGQAKHRDTDHDRKLTV